MEVQIATEVHIFQEQPALHYFAKDTAQLMVSACSLLGVRNISIS